MSEVVCMVFGAMSQTAKERKAEYDRAYYLQHREKKMAQATAWVAAHREANSAFRRRWRQEHPERHAEHEHRRRARKHGVAYEAIDPRTVFERDGWVCHLCELPVADRRTASLDHLVPLADGGTHTYDNVALAHVSCNVKRGRKPLIRRET